MDCRNRKQFLARLLLALAVAGGVLVLGSTEAMAKAKYVFLFIGDGMGLPQSNAAEMYKASLAGFEKPGIVKLNFNEFPAQGMTTTYSIDSLITDSAAAGTAMASGVKTTNAGVGVDGRNKPVKTIAEMARDAGYKVGIVSSVSLDHATPAAFYAHQPTRKNMYEISMQLSKSGFDYFAGGGLVDPEGKKSKIQGEKVNAIEAARKAGYAVVNDVAGFKALKPGQKAMFINPRLQDSQAMAYAMDNAHGDVTLADLTAKGIELLNNKKGFFMMVEGGKIDWACHANDALASIKDTLAFEDAVAKAIAFYKKHPKDTLIIVTGDHETGGLTLGFAGTKYESHFSRLNGQKISYVAFDEKFEALKKTNPRFEQAMAMVEQDFGLKATGDAKDPMVLKDYEMASLKDAFARTLAGDYEKSKNEQEYLLYGGYNPFSVTVTHILNQKAGLAWTSYSHTGVPVLTTAIGAGSEKFNGFYDNTDLFLKMTENMGLKSKIIYLSQAN
ncbi:alkaline phosphatase [Desulfocurvibacter africanus]|uniref:alkaline phosphatase n=1 Tax=Desulfocurvibacter africanus TaxID=873 RepID=UPI000402B948|nr:alkaline phosphatase [Desulfocurvibacter africanus]